MIVSILNYRNIRKLDGLEIEDGKINFLTGISGTGKTAIVKAIQGNIEDLDRRAGSDEEPLVSCSPQPKSVDVFDDSTVDDLYLEGHSHTAFSAVMLKSPSYKEAEEAFYRCIGELRQYEDEIRKECNRYSTLIDQTKAKFKNDGTLTAACAPTRAGDVVSFATSERIELIRERGGKYLSWLNEGTNYDEWQQENKRCPFCRELLRDERIEYINIVASDDGRNIPKVAALEAALVANGIECGDLFVPDNIQKVIAQLEVANQAKEAYSRLLRLLEHASDGVLHQSSLKEDDYAHSPFFDEIPGLSEALSQLKDSERDLKKAFGVLNSEFKGIVNSNTEKINRYLSSFDVPYYFEIETMEKDGRASYRLVHIDCTEPKDYKRKLSYGERNVISLLLFLLKPRGENELVVVDDPVSSYDEFRRVLIYRMLYELQLSNTVLLVSHDHVFAKYALFFRERANRKKKSKADMSSFEIACSEKTGHIIYLENTGGNINYCELCEQDYGILQSHIKERLAMSDLTVRQKVINLRMYLESIPHSDGIQRAAYGYFSVLLHCDQRDSLESKIAAAFSGCAYDEAAVLSWVKEELNIDFPMSDSITSEALADDSGLCQFEQLIAFRETVDDPSLRAELSDMVHLNAALVYCINPYKHLPCSNKARYLLASNGGNAVD